MTGIYGIENKSNGLVYVGQSTVIAKRWIQHKSDLRAGRHCNTALQKAWKKYGEDTFSFFVIEEVEEECLDDAEIMWIEFFNSYLHGYNMTKGGNSTRGLVPWNKGKTHSRETCKKLSESAKKRTGEKNSFYHKKHSTATKEKIREYRSISVVDSGTGTIYPSAKYADLVFGGRSSNVSKVLNGKCQTAYGIKWAYLNEEKSEAIQRHSEEMGGRLHARQGCGR